MHIAYKQPIAVTSQESAESKKVLTVVQARYYYLLSDATLRIFQDDGSLY